MSGNHSRESSRPSRVGLLLNLALLTTLAFFALGCGDTATSPPPAAPGPTEGTAGAGTTAPGALKAGAPPGGMDGASGGPKPAGMK